MSHPGVARRSGALPMLLLSSLVWFAPALAGCDRERPQPPAAAKVGDRLPDVSQPAPPTREEVRAAMLSVYYHAYGLDRLRSDQVAKLPVKPMPLQLAADLLRRDQTTGANARRRRAISKLIAGSVLVGSGPRDPASQGLKQAASVLVGDDGHVKELSESASALVPPGFDRPLLPVAWPKLPIQIQEIREIIATLIADILSKLDVALVPGAARECCSAVQVCDVDPASSFTDPAQVRFEILTRRSVDELRTSIDPQDWDACVPDYFQATDFASDTCADAPSEPPEAAAATTALTAQLPEKEKGSGWDGTLYEHYQADFDAGTTWFKNNLQICGTWDADGERYLYHYALCRPVDDKGSLQSRVLSYPKENGGLKRDCGILIVKDQVPEDAPLDYSVILGVKQILYEERDHEDPGLIPWTNLGLEVLVDQMADTAMCCGAPEDTADCKLLDKHCIQAPNSSKDWDLAVPACETGDDSPLSCSDIES